MAFSTIGSLQINNQSCLKSLEGNAPENLISSERLLKETRLKTYTKLFHIINVSLTLIVS